MERDINAYANVYTGHSFEDTMVKFRRRKVLEILDRYQPKKVLEVGCGLDSIFNYYKKFEKAIIVEPSKKFYEKAVQDCHTRSNIYIYNEVIENCIEDIGSEHFDFILVSCLLHEVIEPYNFLLELVKLMKNNTIMHINVPNAESFHLLWGVESGLQTKIGALTETSKSLQQNTTFTLSSLCRLADNVGLSAAEKGTYFMKPFNHAKMKQCMDNGIIDEKLLEGLYSLVEYFPENGAEMYINCRLK